MCKNMVPVSCHFCDAQEEQTCPSALPNPLELTKKEQGCALLYRQAGRGWDEVALFISAVWIPLYIYLPVLLWPSTSKN